MRAAWPKHSPHQAPHTGQVWGKWKRSLAASGQRAAPASGHGLPRGTSAPTLRAGLGPAPWAHLFAGPTVLTGCRYLKSTWTRPEGGPGCRKETVSVRRDRDHPGNRLI